MAAMPMLAGVGLLMVCCSSASVASMMMGGGEETPPAAAGAGAGAGAEQREWLHRGVGFELRWAKWHSLGGVLASGPVAAVTLNLFGSLEVYPNLALTH